MSTSPRFEKLDARCNPLPADATEFAAVIDNELRVLHRHGNVGDARMTHADAAAACAAIDCMGFSDWRLPTIRELLAIVDYKRWQPAANPEFFPEIQPTWYWSVSPDASDPDFSAWGVNVLYGSSYVAPRDCAGFAHAVRSLSPSAHP